MVNSTRNNDRRSNSIQWRRYDGLWRKHIRPFWQDQQTLIIGVLLLLTLILAIIGFKKCLPQLSFLDYFYLTIQLFVLEFGSVPAPIPWQLELARLLAPIISAYAAIVTFATIFREQFQLLRIRFLRQHAVICGLGRKGLLLSTALREQGYGVVAIENNPENEHLGMCRDHDIFVLLGNATDQDMLRKAQVNKAQYLIAVCGDDGANAAISVQVRELLHGSKRRALFCLVHISDFNLWRLLKEREITAPADDAFRMEFFNVFERGARSMLNLFPVFGPAQETQRAPAHLLVIGVGHMGESLVMRAARDWWALQRNSSTKLTITILDKDAQRKTRLLCTRYPQLEKTCTLHIQEMDTNAPEFQRGDFLFNANGSCKFTAAYVCLDHEANSLATALLLLQKTRTDRLPIVARMNHELGFAALLHGQVDDDHNTLHAFGLLSRTCKLDLLFGGTYEILAQAIHEDYVHKQENFGKIAANNLSMKPWEELPDYLKESNRHQASYIGAKLKAVGCTIIPLTDWDADLFRFASEEIELMAKMEHERWCAERLREGWRYAPGDKNIGAKTTPYLVSWNQLPEAVKQLDRDPANNIPAFLAKLGFQIYRLAKRVDSI